MICSSLKGGMVLETKVVDWGGKDVIKPSDAQSEALIRESSTSVFGVGDMPMQGARIVYGLIIKGQTRHKLL
jgi:hypothetical protein